MQTSTGTAAAGAPATPWQPAAGQPCARQQCRAFFAFWALLALLYIGWLLVFWPGVLGEDSAAISMEVEQPDAFRSGKSVLWYWFVRLSYGTTRRVEVAVAVQMLLCALFFARMLAWYWTGQRRRWCIFLLLSLCATPHMLFFASALYPDALFAAAACALLFELWLLCSPARAHGWLDWAVLALAFPLAVFLRSNGLVFWLPVLGAVVLLRGNSRWLLCAVALLWSLAVWGGGKLHRSGEQSATFPMVLLETAKLLQPRIHTDRWGMTQLSTRTLQILDDFAPRQQIVDYTDPLYWDMLVHHPDGPRFARMPEKQRRALVREFFRYNLWRNLPEVLASRLHLFMAASFAQGSLPSLNYASQVLPRLQTKSKLRKYALHRSEQVLDAVYHASHAARWLLWTPWLGFAMLTLVCMRAWRSKNRPALLVSVPMALQLAGIVVFLSAAEYRYLLPFFLLPLALLPALWSMPRERAASPGAVPLEHAL